MRAIRMTPEQHEREKAVLASLKAADKAFLDFMLAEAFWKTNNSHLLRQ